MVTRNLVEQLFSDPGKMYLNKFWLGADDVFENIRKMSKAAGLPHDIKKISDDTYVIEMAVAGFQKDELKVQMLKDGIRVTGKQEHSEEVEYLYRGIAKRNFDFLFPITFSEGFEVGDVSLKDGLLRVVIQVKKTPLGRLLEIKTENE